MIGQGFTSLAGHDPLALNRRMIMTRIVHIHEHGSARVARAQRLTLAAITAAALGAVLFTGCSPDAPESGIPQTHVTVLHPCEAASRIDDYTVRYEDGTQVYVTPREAVRQSAWQVSRGTRTLAQHHTACNKIVRQAQKDGRPVR